MSSCMGRWYAYAVPSLLLLGVLALYMLSFPPHVQADGGAPNLAYVSGTSSGISVIDVGQAKVIITGLYPPAFVSTPAPTRTTNVPVQQGTASSILPEIVFPTLLIVILVLVFFLARQIRIFLKSDAKSKQR